MGSLRGTSVGNHIAPRGIVLLEGLAQQDVCQLDHEPLLAAPTASGGWSCRSVTTKRGRQVDFEPSHPNGKWGNFTSIHTLKGTPLSWCAKWGLEPDCGAILGHHAQAKAPWNVTRDNAKPLRKFELVLQQIRTRAFSPDATRSGMIKGSLVEDPKSTFSVPAQPDSDHEVSSDHRCQQVQCIRARRSRRARPPRPDYDMYRNVKSKVVHISAHGGAEIFSCGVKISSDYELIHSSQVLDLRKCKPIRTVGQMASGSALGQGELCPQAGA